MRKNVTINLALILLLISSVSEASLVGSEFILEHRYAETLSNSGSVIVEEGAADSFDMLLGTTVGAKPTGYTVDINPTNITIDFYISDTTSRFAGVPDGYINGLYLSSENFDANKFIETATIYREYLGFGQTRITLFDNHSIELNFEEIEWSNNSLLVINFEQTVVPIPSAVWLFGSGLIGLVGLARRRGNA